MSFGFVELHGHEREISALQHGAAEGGDEHSEAVTLMDGVVDEELRLHLQRCDERRGWVRGDYRERQRRDSDVRGVRYLSDYGGCVQERINVLRPYHNHGLLLYGESQNSGVSIISHN